MHRGESRATANLAKYDEFHLDRAGEMLPDLIDAWIDDSM